MANFWIKTQHLHDADRQLGQTSIALLSHLRWFAALIVVMSHIEQNVLSKPGYVAATALPEPGLVTKSLFQGYGYGHAAVIVFFVLSGFLVGGKLIELAASPAIHLKWPYFLVDRFTRIFVVAWPALLLTLTVFLGLIWLLPAAPFVHGGNWAVDLPGPITFDFAATRWLAAGTMLNDLVAPTLNTNSPIWSLAYEWSYYIMGLATVLAYRVILSPAALLVIAYGVALLLLCLINQPDIIFSGVCWVAGAISRQAFNRLWLRGALTQVSGIGAVITVLVLLRKYPMPDPVLGAAVAFMIAHSAWARWTLGAAWGERMAGFSYSLYALHFPVMLALMGVMFAVNWLPQQLPFNFFGLTTATAILLLIVAVARLFAYVTEDRTAVIRHVMVRCLGLSSYRDI